MQAGALSQDQEEKWNGLAQHLGSGPSGQTQIEIAISRWSTEEEANALLQVLQQDGAKKLADALDKEKETGFVRFPRVRTRFPSTRLSYARQFTNGDKRTIIIATNRPIGFWEAVSQGRSMDYELTLIELHLDADGSGEGVLAVGAEISWDADKNQIVVENYSTAPVKLLNITQSH